MVVGGGGGGARRRLQQRGARGCQRRARRVHWVRYASRRAAAPPRTCIDASPVASIVANGPGSRPSAVAWSGPARAPAAPAPAPAPLLPPAPPACRPCCGDCDRCWPPPPAGGDGEARGGARGRRAAARAGRGDAAALKGRGPGRGAARQEQLPWRRPSPILPARARGRAGGRAGGGGGGRAGLCRRMRARAAWRGALLRRARGCVAAAAGARGPRGAAGRAWAVPRGPAATTGTPTHRDSISRERAAPRDPTKGPRGTRISLSWPSGRPRRPPRAPPRAHTSKTLRSRPAAQSRAFQKVQSLTRARDGAMRNLGDSAGPRRPICRRSVCCLAVGTCQGVANGLRKPYARARGRPLPLCAMPPRPPQCPMLASLPLPDGSAAGLPPKPPACHGWRTARAVTPTGVTRRTGHSP
jgi:hypothetical protein